MKLLNINDARIYAKTESYSNKDVTYLLVFFEDTYHVYNSNDLSSFASGLILFCYKKVVEYPLNGAISLEVGKKI